MIPGTQRLPTSLFPAAAAAVLDWQLLAGVDALVEAGPRNWLAPPRVSPAAVPSLAPRATVAPPAAVVAGAGAVADAAAALAAGADSPAALAEAAARFDHPLRISGTLPQLFAGNVASGIWVIADQPEAADSPAARLRTRMLAAIGLGGDDHALAHLLPWPTTGGRPPRDEEIAAFAPFLARALSLAPPRFILALGERAAGLSGPVRGLASVRGRWLGAGAIPLLATFHPRLLLTQPELKRLAWADLQAFAAAMGTP